MTLFLLATCKVPHVKIYIKPEQLLDEERGELTSSNEFETIPPNVLFYQYSDLGWVYQQRKKDTDPKALYDKMFIHSYMLQGMEVYFWWHQWYFLPAI